VRRFTGVNLFYGSEFSWNTQKERKHYILLAVFYQFVSRSFGLSPTFAEYRSIKKSFFDTMPKTAFTLSILTIKWASDVTEYCAKN
jgi:hypothetical protein